MRMLMGSRTRCHQSWTALSWPPRVSSRYASELRRASRLSRLSPAMRCASSSDAACLSDVLRRSHSPQCTPV